MTTWTPNAQQIQRHGITSGILAALTRDIDSGRLRPGSRLPTHRELAARLGVAIGSVTRAYARAKADGLVAGTTGSGMFVAGREEGASERENATVNLAQNFVSRDPRDVFLRKSL